MRIARCVLILGVGLAVAPMPLRPAPIVAAQTPTPVDFARDVQPILVEHCVACHGPARQENGYRLDRRSAAFTGLMRPNIIARSSQSSPLYHRISGNQRGPQMPPTGALLPEQIETLRRWIDEGAAWPDDLAGETTREPDENAQRLIDRIRRADREAVRREVERNAAIVNARGHAGSTPLMYAALYGDTGLVGAMLKAGADPNVRNDAGATALMWAVEHVDVVQLLLRAGADPNAASLFDRRTALRLAAMQAGSAPVVELLLARGAKPAQIDLTTAAQHGRVDVVRLLLRAGVRDNGAAAIAALQRGCGDCLAAITGVQELPPLRGAVRALLPIAAPGDEEAVRDAIARGAEATAPADPRLPPVLVQAARGAHVTPRLVQWLLDNGASFEGLTSNGLTVVDLARRSGNTAVADVLVEAGAKSSGLDVAPELAFVTSNTADAAIRRSLPLLQRTALEFYEKGACVSCHHNSLTQVTVAAARTAGFRVDEGAARRDLETTARDVIASHDQAVQGIAAPGGWVTTTGYILMGLEAGARAADAGTDALVRLIRVSQRPDGRWFSVYRPPIEASDVTATAVSLRGLQLYGSREPGSADGKAVVAATAWLARTQPKDTEDRAFRLLGLTWGRAAAPVRDTAMRDLAAAQRPDGGWGQLPSLSSDAYATGQALVALSEAGMRSGDVVYRRGVEFLLRTQLADGSWFVPTRSHPTQAYFESGFPHGEHQYISAAATNWATQALIRTLVAGGRP